MRINNEEKTMKINNEEIIIIEANETEKPN